MTPSTEAVKAAVDKAGYHANVSAVMAILQAAYDVDFEALRAENTRLQAELAAYKRNGIIVASDYRDLRVENARLREALKPIIPDKVLDEEEYSLVWNFHLNAARAAMGEMNG